MGTGSAHGENRAADAARLATESPLLDDVNLKGARGILCNITAGSDLSMQEFEQVGDVLENISATDANVVLGTSINNEMEGEIRVTVVASGLEGDRVRKPMRVVRSNENRKSAEAKTGYGQYEKPALERSNRKTAPTRSTAEASEVRASVRERREIEPRKRNSRPDPVSYDTSAATDGEMSYLDLPTFLRRQAD